MIQVNDLVKVYGNHPAVDHLSFHVDKGEIYGFLGPNGAGKSTTMNIMTGYIAPTAGTVLINGYEITKEAEEAKKQIGYLPELPPLYMDMTVLEYLQFCAELKKVPKKERASQILDVIEMTEIADMKDRLIKNLSKGYRQRVGLSQAILGHPEILILDEPTVGLDPKQIIEIRDLIRKLSKDHTILLSSHILSEVSAVCQKIMIINKGKLIACDTPDGLQKMLTGGESVYLTVKGNKEAVMEALHALPAGCSVKEAAKQDREGTYSVEIISDTEAVRIKGEESHGNESEAVRIKEEEPNGNESEAESSDPAENKIVQSDIREILFHIMATHDLPILTMQKEEQSLEHIFLELTDQGSSI